MLSRQRGWIHGYGHSLDARGQWHEVHQAMAKSPQLGYMSL